jgi:Coiled stalk of trimeric autotransporter adhesin
MAKQFLVNIDLNSNKIVNLAPGSSGTDAVNVNQLNSAIEGLAWKDSARVATTSNINLASPGSSLDGVTMATNDRVLVRGQTSTLQNGIYIWNGASTPMSRSLDASTTSELEQAIIAVEEGTSAGSSFRQTQVNFTLETDPVLWTAFGTVAPPASETTQGIAEIATQAETDTGTDDTRFVTPLKLTTWGSRARVFAQTIGDGSATLYTVTHNFNTRDVIVQVYRNSGSFDEVIVDVNRALNSVDIVFAAAPSSNQFRVVVKAGGN